MVYDLTIKLLCLAGHTIMTFRYFFAGKIRSLVNFLNMKFAARNYHFLVILFRVEMRNKQFSLHQFITLDKQN